MPKLFKLLCTSLLGAALVLGMPRESSAQVGTTGGRGSATAEAKKKISEMQAELKALKAEKDKIRERLLAEFLEKDEWKDTMNRHRKAKAASASAKKDALAAVKASPEYKELAREREALVKKQDELNDRGASADLDEISRVGTELAKKATALKNMEKDAVEQDERSLAAKEEFAEAEKEKRELDAEVEDAMLSDPDFESLDTKIEQVETQLDSARTQLAQQQKSEAAARRNSRPKSAAGAGGGAGAKGYGGKAGGKGGKGYR